MNGFTRFVAVGAVTLAVALLVGCQDGAVFKSEVDTAAKPWTDKGFANKAENFQFAIVSDLHGGNRPGVFAKAVGKLNMLQPEFVLSVGDLIEGYSDDSAKVDAMWAEFDQLIAPLEMPFFRVPGNHDTTNPMMARQWERRFGRRYYAFTYHNVLFMVLDSIEDKNDTRGTGLSSAQIDWAQKTLKRHPNVRWTVLLFHKPLWVIDEGGAKTARKDYSQASKTGFGEVRKALAGRKHTIFAGHIHEYIHFTRDGMKYITLSTTGGGSRLRGIEHGEFDHVTWVTMTKDGPRVANLLLDGILPADVRSEDHARIGRLVFEGEPVDGDPAKLTVTLPFKNPFDKQVACTVSWSKPDGSGWSITPSEKTFAVEAGATRSIRFQAVYKGNLDGIFPLPQARIAVRIPGAFEREITAALPYDVFPHLGRKARVAAAKAADKAPTVDGALDEALWKRPADADNFSPIGHAGKGDFHGKAPVDTRVWFAHDATNLYVAARCDEPAMKNLRAKATKPDGATYSDDSIELLIDTNGDRETYHQFVINTAGVIFDAEGWTKAWSGKAVAAVKLAKDGWTLEVAIPWASVGRPVKPGQPIRLLLVRNRCAGGRHEVLQWTPAPLPKGHHNPAVFGTLKLLP